MKPSSQSRYQLLRSLGYILFALASFLLLSIVLDSIFHLNLGFDWFTVLVQLPFISLITAVSSYAAFKETRSPSKQQSTSPKKRILSLSFVLLYLGLPVAGIWSIVADISTCREVKTRGKEVFATVEKTELRHYVIRTYDPAVRTLAEANQLWVRLKFTAGDTTVAKDIIPYLPNRDVIAKAWDEAQTGSLKVRYLPENPKTFYVAAAPCQESIFAAFVQDK